MTQQRIELTQGDARLVVDVARRKRHAQVHPVVLCDRDDAKTLVRCFLDRAQSGMLQRERLAGVLVEKRERVPELFGKPVGLMGKQTRRTLVGVLPHHHDGVSGRLEDLSADFER